MPELICAAQWKSAVSSDATPSGCLFLLPHLCVSDGKSASCLQGQTAAPTRCSKHMQSSSYVPQSVLSVSQSSLQHNEGQTSKRFLYNKDMYLLFFQLELNSLFSLTIVSESTQTGENVSCLSNAKYVHFQDLVLLKQTPK